jgi:predicted small secreted protein
MVFLSTGGKCMQISNLKSICALFLILAMRAGLYGCNPVEGAGKEIEKAGDSIKDEAREHK